MAKKIALKEVTPEMIEAWKGTHGFVFKYETEDKKYGGIFRSPTREEMAAAQAIADKPLKSNELLAKATLLAGDEELITRDEYFYGLGEKLKGIVKKVEGELTEL